MMSRHWHRQQCSFALLRAALNQRRRDVSGGGVDKKESVAGLRSPERDTADTAAMKSSKDAESSVDKGGRKGGRVDSAMAPAGSDKDKARTLPRSFSGNSMPSRSLLEGKKTDAKRGAAA